LVTFSFLNEDSIVRIFSNRRGCFGGVEEWLENKERGFLFIILESQDFRHSSNNLVYSSYHLIDSFITKKQIIPKKLNLYFDGRVSGNDKNNLREFFKRKGIESVVSRNFQSPPQRR